MIPGNSNHARHDEPPDRRIHSRRGDGEGCRHIDRIQTRELVRLADGKYSETHSCGITRVLQDPPPPPNLRRSQKTPSSENASRTGQLVGEKHRPAVLTPSRERSRNRKKPPLRTLPENCKPKPETTDTRPKSNEIHGHSDNVNPAGKDGGVSRVLRFTI